MEGEVQMTGKFLFPLWKRGIKADLLESRGGFLGRRAADFFEALNQGERKKSPLAPLFQRGEQKDRLVFCGR